MIVALNKLLPEKPDLVISGINRGGNMGENIFYSGTVGAAAEAAINRIPAIAISVVHRGKDFRFDRAAEFARNLAEVVLRDGMTDGIFLNVNVPNEWNGGGVRFTRQSEKVTRNVLQDAPIRADELISGCTSSKLRRESARTRTTPRFSRMRFQLHRCI